MPDLIPAEQGIFDRHPERPLDSGSPLRFGRNDGRRDNYETVDNTLPPVELGRLGFWLIPVKN
jgi:hypothetical protein